jgi:hypothetical protein
VGAASAQWRKSCVPNTVACDLSSSGIGAVRGGAEAQDASSRKLRMMAALTAVVEHARFVMVFLQLQ